MFNVRTRVCARHQQQVCVPPARVDHHRHATITPLYPKLVLGLLPPPAGGALASAGLVEVDYGRLGVLSSTAAYTFHFQIKPRRHSAQLASVLETGVADEEAEREFDLVYVWLGREAEDGAHAAARAQVGRALRTHGEAKVMSIFVVVGRTRGCRRASLSYDMYLLHQAVGAREFLLLAGPCIPALGFNHTLSTAHCCTMCAPALRICIPNVDSGDSFAIPRIDPGGKPITTTVVRDVAVVPAGGGARM